MHILLLGSGGREHALAWKIAASPLVTKLWCAPGNAGIAREAECVALDIADHAAVIDFCKRERVEFVVVGPETPLAAGIVDDLARAGIKAFGPSKQASQLEGSKGFTKALCTEFGIPTGAYGRFTSAADALAYVRQQGAPIVVKADGLAAGKGVVVAMTMAEAEAAIAMMFDGAFGAAGAEVVIEEFLSGREISFFALSDGDTAIALASAQDHKRVFDHDQGPNTGGMGAYSPTPFVTRGSSRPDHVADHSADGQRHEGARHAVSRRALCRRDADGRRSKAVRIQCPLRRSGMPGLDAADDVGPRAGDAGVLRRPAQEFRPALVSGTAR